MNDQDVENFDKEIGKKSLTKTLEMKYGSFKDIYCNKQCMRGSIQQSYNID